MVSTILVLLALAAFGWWWTGPSSDELVVYPASCSDGGPVLPRSQVIRSGSIMKDLKQYKADRASCVILTLNPTVYKLNKARGEVYYKLGDQVERLVDCSIFSQIAWTCSYPDGSAKVVIIDGLRAIHADDVSRPGGVHFSLRRWQWWVVTLYWWISQPQGAWLIPEQHEYY